MPSSVHGPLVREWSTELQLLELCRVSLSRDSCSGRRPVPAQMCVTESWEPSELPASTVLPVQIQMCLLLANTHEVFSQHSVKGLFKLHGPSKNASLALGHGRRLSTPDELWTF
ncbi:unnamed protein product [Lepidochelys kempii]